MILFIRKIPANTRLKELIGFIEPAVKGGLFRRGGVISDAKILALRDLRLRTLEFHGLVTVEPDKAAARAIKLLKGKRFKGKFVVIRQYFQRDWHNDPRQRHQGGAALNVQERRKADRRRGRDLEVIEDISEQFSNAGDFVRKNL